MSKIRKALVAAAAAGVAYISSALAAGQSLTSVAVWIGAVVAAGVAGFAAWRVPNTTR